MELFSKFQKSTIYGKPHHLKINFYSLQVVQGPHVVVAVAVVVSGKQLHGQSVLTTVVTVDGTVVAPAVVV